MVYIKSLYISEHSLGRKQTSECLKNTVNKTLPVRKTERPASGIPSC